MKNTIENKERLITFFDKDTMPVNPEAVENMSKELARFPGPLHFKTEKHEDGWMVQCAEIPGIITGNTNPNPSSEEIESHIRDAIRSAFNISVVKIPAKQIRIEETVCA